MHDLLQRAEVLSALLAQMRDGLSVIDAQGVQIYVNDSLCEMLGFERAELLGRTPPYPYWPPEELTVIEAAFRQTLRGQTASFELAFCRKDGARIVVSLVPAELRDDNGAVVGFFATIKDVSEHKRLLRSLAASEQRWRSIAENPFDFVIVIDADYRYTYVNHTAPGIAPESLIGRATPFDFVDAQYHAVMRSSFETTFTTGRATSYDVYVPQLGTWYSSIVGAIFEEGKVSSLSVLTRDITSQKHAENTLRLSEQRLRDAHKMETVGTLACGIAHDINNILTPILAYSSLAVEEMPADHAVQEYLQGIILAAERARELVQRILLFSRRQDLRKALFDLRDCVNEDVRLLRASLPASIELVTQLPSEPVVVFADRGQISQLLTNVATNAFQAMRDSGGKLTIALALVEGDPLAAQLSLTDTGPGMTPETARRAFEPFFTTKPVGAGTGLGLSIAHGVVTEHGGEITIRSAPGEGTTITVRLPTSSGREPRGVTSSASKPASTGGLRVLVVDDEPAIVAVACASVKGLGHHAVGTVSALEALGTFERDPEAFDVLLTDQSMSQMLGTTLVAKVRAIRPAVRCLLMTGLDDESTRRLADTAGVLEVIPKPFSRTTLAAVLARAVEPVPPAAA